MWAELFEYGNEHSGFIRGGEFLDQHGHCPSKGINTLFLSFISAAIIRDVMHK
jgi:hypothetical protein